MRSISNFKFFTAATEDVTALIRASEPHRRICIVTEWDYEALPTGVAERAKSLERSLTELGAQVTRAALATARRRSLLERLREANIGRAALAKRLSDSDLYVYVALGNPILIQQARRHSRTTTVAVDVCDSQVGQLINRARARQGRLVLASIWCIAEVALLPSRIARLYISAKDTPADHLLNRRSRVIVVGPRIDPSLSTLRPVKYPLKQIVLVADLNSFHNRRGIDMLSDALTSANLPSDLEVKFFGPAAPAFPTATGIHYAGYIQPLIAAYEGDTAIYISNIGGTGVPNKLLQALAAKRPIIVHASHELPWQMTRQLDDIYTFGDNRGLVEALQRLANKGRAGSTILEGTQ